jgi:hypothetical protein
MPSAAIDTFFACTVLIAAALIATASLTATMQTNINNMQGLNQPSYLKNVAEQIVTSVGSPVDWGSNDISPVGFGLAQGDSDAYMLDVDKVCRLNSQSSYLLSATEAAYAARLNKIAFGISVNQMLSIVIESTGNSTVGETTTYSFEIKVKANLAPTKANLHCYIIAKDSIQNISEATSNAGVGDISFQLQSASSGNVLLVVFARATIDDRLTAYETYAFTHLSGEVLPNQTFLKLSPLNNKLNVNVTSPSAVVDECFAFTYQYQTEADLVSSETYQIPSLVDNSPIVLVATGTNEGSFFSEWTAYPSVPLSYGSNFANTDQNTFVYTVTIKGVLYRLTVTLGEVSE